MFLRFALCWLMIIAMASLDTYLTVKHSSVMEDVELNPMGIMVLRSSGGVPLLAAMKTAGVALALLFSVALWQRERLRPKVLLSSYSVATLGVGMLCYMSMDIVGIQTERWAREMPDPSCFSNSPAHFLRTPPPGSGTTAAVEPPRAEAASENAQSLHTGERVVDNPPLIATSDKNEHRNTAPARPSPERSLSADALSL
jgi:hypothetical protein